MSKFDCSCDISQQQRYYSYRPLSRGRADPDAEFQHPPAFYTGSTLHQPAVPQVQHYKDALAGNLRQLPVFQTSHDNPLIPHPADSGSGENSTQADAHRSLKNPQDILRARR